jgi:hypothetical protein
LASSLARRAWRRSEVAGDLSNGALEAVGHAADAVEYGGFLFECIEPGVPESGFGVAEAIETPGIGGELVEELLLDGAVGTPGFFELCDESLEFFGILAGDNERFGMDAVFEGVQATGGFSFGRGRPMGESGGPGKGPGRGRDGAGRTGTGSEEGLRYGSRRRRWMYELLGSFLSQARHISRRRTS